mmetsp:Transcript_1936/g.3073  ORF Transcript_1936/g.3073 Transcript_1936/m.3073 type:complete len:1099 (+) Transcript_1936:22-3318(+)
MEEKECRVCREGPEDGHPLYAPCLCNGSILYCHQDCLEGWLQHSQKDSCELCGAKYIFRPKYADDMPDVIPLTCFVSGTVSYVLNKVCPFVGRVLLAAVCWLALMPMATSVMYRWFMFPSFTVMIDFSFSNWKFDVAFLWNDIVTGILLTGLVGLSFIILMSFADFLRSYWLINQRRRNRRARVRNANRQVPAQFAAQVDELDQRQQEFAARNLNPDLDAPLPMARRVDEADGDVREPQQDATNGHLNQQIPADTHGAVGNDQGNDENVGGLEERRDDDEDADSDVEGAIQDELVDLNDEELAAILNLLPDDVDDNMNAEENNAPANDENRRAQADIEVHINIYEVLGLRGPQFAVVRYTLWVIAFNVCCMLVGMFIPSCLGDVFILLIKPYCMLFIKFVGSILPPHVVESLLQTWSLLVTPSAPGTIIRLCDLLVALIGYSGGAVVVYLLSHIGNGMKYFMSNRLTHTTSIFFSTVSALKDIIKIGVLLGVRIFVVPCVIGCMVLWCANIIIQFPIDSALVLAGNYIVSAIAVSWGVGIAHMLCATIAILQLREVLHPELLAPYIRPQESQADMLTSLLMDSLSVQFRRLVVSFLVYAILIMVFVWTPVVGLKVLLDLENPVNLHVWYIVPEIQVPLEVAVLHTVFLMMLEKHKDTIGHVEHYGLLYLATKLGMNRYLLPYTAKRIESDDERDRALREKKEIVKIQGEVEAIVGQPMFRPPAGWDARTRVSPTRWSWNASHATELELSVAPRTYPSFWILRLFLMLIVCWLVVVVASFTIAVLPLSVGRLVAYLLLVPHSYIHDPVCILVGYAAISTSRRYLQSVHSCVGVLNMPLLSLDLSTLASGAFGLLVWVVAFPYCVGLAYFMIVYPYTCNPADEILYFSVGMSLADHLRCLFLGSMLVNWISILICSGAIDRILTKLGYLPLFDNWTYAVNTSWSSIVDPTASNDSRISAVRSAICSFDRLVVSPIALPHIYSMLTIMLLERGKLYLTPVDPTQYTGVFQLIADTIVHARSPVGKYLMWAYALYLFGTFVSKPVLYWCQWYYNSIKDENYLVGMELQNSNQGAKAMEHADEVLRASAGGSADEAVQTPTGD